MDVTLTLSGDQIGTYTSVNGSGNNADRVVTVEGLQAIGTSADTYTVLVEQVNSGVTEFQNGQFVTIYDSLGNIVMPRTSINPDQEQGLAAGDEHLIITSTNFVIDLGGIPSTATTVTYDIDDENAVVGDDDDDGELDFTSFPCFGLGTRIETSRGGMNVEKLRPDMQVRTASGSFRRVRWVGVRTIALQPGSTRQRPIQFKTGCLGPDLPNRDLVLSPQHCVRLDGTSVRQTYSTDYVLSRAKGLVALPQVRWMRGKTQVTYVSVLLDTHDVILANGLAVESLYPGTEVLRCLGPKLRRELYDLVPGLKQWGVAAYGHPAHRILRVQEARKFIRESNFTKGCCAKSAIARPRLVIS
jgi:hypothetical protein